MRDWTKAFRRASFKGVGFWVDSDGPEGGRRVAVHEISGGEAPVVEDMGRLTRTISVGAYVASDTSDLQGLALEAILDTPGPGVLILPMDAFQTAICTGWARDRRKDRNGCVAYDLSFVEAGFAGLPLLSGLSVLRDVFGAGRPFVANSMQGLV